MNLRGKKKALMGVVGGAGVVAALGGFVGGWYSTGTTIVLAFGTWILGATIVNLIAD